MARRNDAVKVDRRAAGAQTINTALDASLGEDASCTHMHTFKI